MAHEDIVFNDKNFVDNQAQLLRKFTDPSNPTIGTNAFFAAYRSDSQRLPGWDTFVQQLSTDTGSPVATIEQTYFDNYKVKVLASLGGDWSVLSALGVTDADIRNQFKNAFQHFALSYPYVDVSGVGRLGPAGSEKSTFLANWAIFLARTVDIQDASEGPVSGIDMMSYDAVYTTFFPSATPAEFSALLKEFYDEVLEDTGGGNVDAGWFIPSQVFHLWFDKVRDKYETASSLSSVELKTTASSGTARRVLVLDRILRLLIELIDVLQRISAAQAQRLNFLTAWQSAYTVLLTNVPQFAQGDGTPLGKGDNAPGDFNDDTSKVFRNEVVNPHMQSILENVRAKRSSVQDEAKQLQTSINSSQDAANQQTQIATSLLQQISGILSQIYR